MRMVTCTKCNREFKNNSGLGSHKKICDGTPYKPYVKWSCPKCGMYVHSKKERHVEICDGLGPGAHRRASYKGVGRGWNKGTKASDAVRSKISESLKGKPWKPKSPESELARRKKISETMRSNPSAGGYRPGSGVGKGCWHNSPISGQVYLDSTYEKRLANYLDQKGIPWQRNKERFPYTFKDKEHSYIPDFKINGVFVEVKGYTTEKDRAKWKFFPHKLIILTEDDIINLESGGLPKWS